MRIAQVAPLWECVPPKTYGGTELVVHLLSKHLARRGHDVTVYASADSTLSPEYLNEGSLVHMPFSRSLRKLSATPMEAVSYELEMIGTIINHSGEFDIIHNHLGWQMLPFSDLCASPVVTTLHGALSMADAQFVHQRFWDRPFISISDFQRVPCPWLNYQQTIYHGIELDNYDYDTNPTNKHYAAFLGRISPEKGVHHAIEIARKTGIPLIIAGKIDPVDRDYYRQKIKPHIDGKKVSFIGEVNHEEKITLLKNAYVSLCPVTWPEPFGLVLIESMACGTPVLALKNGSIPEVIADGETGFVRETPKELIRAFKDLDQISRVHCRRHVAKYFSIKRMIDEHVALYERLSRHATTSRPNRDSSLMAMQNAVGVCHTTR